MNKEYPILFKGAMVRAILDGKKTQTRRLKANWKVGDKLWVRETFARNPNNMRYKADKSILEYKETWTPSIHMPRTASRITLKVTGMREECLQDITEADAIAEGLTSLTKDGNLFKWGVAKSDNCPDDSFPWSEWEKKPIDAFIKLWDSCAPDGNKWADNPKVIVTEFKVVK